LASPLGGKTCPAIDGILEEGSDILEEYKGAPALDAGLVAAAQTVEHYEIAHYGTLIAWAEQLGKPEAVIPELSEMDRARQIYKRPLTRSRPVSPADLPQIVVDQRTSTSSSAESQLL
jgi:hypothetical protein